MARNTTSTYAENFKGQLRSTTHAAQEAKNYAKGLKGMSGSQELEWAADKIIKAVEEVNKMLERVIRYYPN